MRCFWAAFLLLAGALAVTGPARAQSTQPVPSPSQIQHMIAAGQEAQAVAALQGILQTHPKSAVGWYLLAEAYDAQNNETGAADALNMADRLAPGLPFANAQEVAALRAHVNKPQSIGGGHIALYVVIGLVLLLLLLRFLPGRNVASRNYGYTAPPPPPGTPPYGFGYGGPQPMGGGGIGSALVGGLAAGAGFAAGERIIDGMMGGHNNGGNTGGPFIDPGNTQQGGPDLSRDDGLMGNPGWDDSSSGGNDGDDLNNSW
jgi:hypothetical protein